MKGGRRRTLEALLHFVQLAGARLSSSLVCILRSRYSRARDHRIYDIKCGTEKRYFQAKLMLLGRKRVSSRYYVVRGNGGGESYAQPWRIALTSKVIEYYIRVFNTARTGNLQCASAS